MTNIETAKIMLTHILGLLLPDAYSLAEKHGFSVRVTRIEGVSQICTRDHRLDRVNIEVQSGKVQAAYIG